MDVDLPKDKPDPITGDMLVRPAVRLIDFERGMSRFPPVTTALIAGLGLIFLWQNVAGFSDSTEGIIKAGALYRAGLGHGEVWRLITAFFLHYDWGHLLGNCIMLYIAGMACEHIYGSRQLFLVFVAAGIAGGIVSMLTQDSVTVGASGAIFGLVGLFIAFLWSNEERFFLRDKRIYLALTIWSVYSIWTAFFTPHIDNMCHIGGFLTGIFAMLLLRPVLVDSQGPRP